MLPRTLQTPGGRQILKIPEAGAATSGCRPGPRLELRKTCHPPPAEEAVGEAGGQGVSPPDLRQTWLECGR